MTIEVKNCKECPFIEMDASGETYCLRACVYIDEKEIDYIHENCPLKTEPITVKIHEPKTETE